MDYEETTPQYFDDGVHTPENPYCSNFACWCHSASAYHQIVTEPLTTDGDIELAYTFFGLTGQERRTP